MKQIAILITCFNRKPKTLACLKHIYEQENIDDINIDIFIVDGGQLTERQKLLRPVFRKLISVFTMDYFGQEACVQHGIWP